MIYTEQYEKILETRKRIPRSNIKPRNIYRLGTYKGKHSQNASKLRYVYVIGIVGDKIHCLKLNEINPIHFIELVKKIKNPQIEMNLNNRLSDYSRKFSLEGTDLFDNYIKGNDSLYSTTVKSYRTYFIRDIVNIWEVEIEYDFLSDIFNESTNKTKRRVELEKEIDETD